MNDRKRFLRILGVVIFAAGVIIGTIFYGFVLWSDFEASFFDASIRTQKSIPRLSCPILITNRDAGKVSASLENTIDRPIRPRVRTHITDGSYILMREAISSVEIQPGEQKQLNWDIRVGDAAWDRFVLTRVFVFATYPIPAMSGYCGTVALPISTLTGSQVVGLTLISSLLCLAAGMGLWITGNRNQRGRNNEVTAAMGLLAGVTLAGIVFSLVGWWLVAGILFLMTILISVGVLAFVISRYNP